MILIKKRDRCPICKYQILPPNKWVQYHVSYNPEIVILACSYCNYVEFLLRNGIKKDTAKVNSRIEQVIMFQKKYNVIL